MQDWRNETPYGQPTDWLFASSRIKGKQPPSASIMVEDYVRPAEVGVGILSAGDQRRFGFHNLRHSLASFLVSVGTNPKVVQGLLRHSDVHTTLQLYSQRKRRSAGGSGHHARCDGCQTGVGELKTGLAPG